MRNVLYGLLALLALAIVSCGKGGVPSSSIYILERDTGRIMSTSKTRGAVTLFVGESVHFKIERLTSTGDQTNTSDVTTVCNYLFIPEGIASASTLGELRGMGVGTTRLEVRFRPDSLSDADRVYLDITVIPEPDPED